MTGILGGDGAAKRAAAEQKAQQAVANDRQLAELRTQDENTGTTRRNPRGRRLFVGDPAQKTDLS